MTIATTDHIRRLPKVELHCHVEGAARASTIKALAQRHGVAFPVDDPADLETRTQFDIIVVLHGTAGFDDACAPSGGSDTLPLVAGLASLGYIVVGWNCMNSMSFSGSPARSAIDMPSPVQA